MAKKIKTPKTDEELLDDMIMEMDDVQIEDELELEGMEDTEDGGLLLTLSEPDEEVDTENSSEILDFDTNLAELIEDADLSNLAMKLTQRFDSDRSSMDTFLETTRKAIENLGISIETLNDPFPGATPIRHPQILESSVKSQARIMGQLFNGSNLVDAYAIAHTDPQAVDLVNRVKNYMNYQYLDQMDEYYPETDRLAFRYSITGNAYRKYYYDPIEDRPMTRYVTEDKFIINTNQTTLRKADFYTELFTLDKHELEQLIEIGEYLDFTKFLTGQVLSDEDAPVNLDGLQGVTEYTDVDFEINQATGEGLGLDGSTGDKDKFELREHHCYLKLPEGANDGETRSLPYIVTIESSTQKVLAIRRNWKQTDPRKLKRMWYVHYPFIRGLGFHGYGYAHLLCNFERGLTQMLRSLIDAGQFANLQGGFTKKGVRFTKDYTMPIKPGEFRPIETGGETISDVIYPLNFKEPSQVMERMIIWMDQRIQKFADSADAIVADASNYGPVGTILAMLEQSRIFMTGIDKRLRRALNEEFKILYDLNNDTLDDTFDFNFKGKNFTVQRADFDGSVAVMPACDPNMMSTSHKIAMAQTKLTAAQQSPQLHDMRSAYQQFYGALGMEQDEIDILLPQPQSAVQQDPLSDIIAVAQGKPIKAFPGQDHDAHIQFKTTFLNDPQGGQLPTARAIIPLVQANIAEHQLLKYISRMEMALKQVQQMTPEQMAGGFAVDQALVKAGEIVKNLNAMDTNLELLQSQDPVMIAAMAAAKEASIKERDSQIRAADLKHKIEKDTAKAILEKGDQELKAAKLANDSIAVDKKLASEHFLAKFDAGTNMVETALKDLAKPNNTTPKK